MTQENNFFVALEGHGYLSSNITNTFPIINNILPLALTFYSRVLQVHRKMFVLNKHVKQNEKRAFA